MLPNIVNHRGLVFKTYSVTVMTYVFYDLLCVDYLVGSHSIGVITDDTRTFPLPHDSPLILFGCSFLILIYVTVLIDTMFIIL